MLPLFGYTDSLSIFELPFEINTKNSSIPISIAQVGRSLGISKFL